MGLVLCYYHQIVQQVELGFHIYWALCLHLQHLQEMHNHHLYHLI